MKINKINEDGSRMDWGTSLTWLSYDLPACAQLGFIVYTCVNKFYTLVLGEEQVGLVGLRVVGLW